MKELKKAYDSLVENHENFLEDARKKTVAVKLSRLDFFSLEPLYHEVRNISQRNFKFYDDIDEMPSGNEIHICSISSKHLLHSRNSFAEETYYDSFYTYSDNEKWRLELYCNPQLKKPIKVERLKFGKYNLPICYEVYQKDSYWKFDYSFSGDDEKIECNYYDGNGQFQFQKLLDVHYSKAANGVETIVEITDGERREIYNYQNLLLPRDELIEKAKTIIIESILDDLEREKYDGEDIECVLLEYTCQNPFPPHLGMSPKKALEENDNPLLYYWVNEMDCQIEMDIASTDGSLVETLNNLFVKDFDSIGFDIDDNERQIKTTKITSEIFDIYVDICKRLKRKKRLKSLIPTTRNFHVTARDFESCNEWQYLQALLPKTTIKSLAKQIEKYNNRIVLKPEEMELLKELNDTLETEEKRYSSLKQSIETKDLVFKYGNSDLYFNEPFGFEQAYHKPKELDDNAAYELLSEEPKNDTYYQYALENGKPIYISKYEHNKLVSEKFLNYQANSTKIHSFYYYSSGLKLQNYVVIELDNDRVKSIKNYRNNVLENIIYSYDGHQLKGSIETTTMIDEKFVNYQVFRKTFEYDDNNNIYKITRFFDNQNRSVVEYCKDDSFMNELIDKLVKQSTQDIIDSLTSHNVKPAIALVLEIRADVTLPFFNFSLVMPAMKNEFHWETIQAKNGLSGFEDIYLNFMNYTAISGSEDNETNYFSTKQTKFYIDKTFNTIGTEIEKMVKKKFGKKVQVLFTGEYESNERINNYLLSKGNP